MTNRTDHVQRNARGIVQGSDKTPGHGRQSHSTPHTVLAHFLNSP